MYPVWRKELNRLLILLSVVGLIGYILERPLPAILLVLVPYLGLSFYQLRRIHLWLAQDHLETESTPPESFGLWGDVFDGIYHLQRRERQANDILKNLIEKAQESTSAMEMAVVAINKDGKLDWWNQAAETLLGFSHPVDKNRAVINLVRDPAFLEYFNKADYSRPLKIHSPGSLKQMLEYQITQFGEGERLMLVKDVTQYHRLEKMRKDFIGNVSHELRTPITVIKGYLEAILEHRAELGEKWYKPLLQMQQQSGRMENIVNDLLLLTSLETSNITGEQQVVMIADMLQEIVRDTEQAYVDKLHHYEVSCDDSIRFLAEHKELYSAILNLTINAAKYSPEKSCIKLAASITDEWFELSVADNGIGIEEKHLPRITERFYRVDSSRASSTGGTGLGLAIVKHILARHSGELIVTSEVGVGSYFICRLPLSRINPLLNTNTKYAETVDSD
ncbi:MAG: phosphate regulon sensor histidine kinase PhoR [Pseudohongiella sp.]|nr:phosphate regulon sensor histidine kinase PhoR [Pseudohongiella sp.]